MNSKLPENIAYLSPMLQDIPDALLHGEAAEIYISQLPLDVISKLESAYESIANQGNDKDISNYIYSVNSTYHDPVYRKLKNLQLIFDALAKRGANPFNSGRLIIKEPSLGKPNWELAPAELRYLGPYAEKYGHWVFDEDINKQIAKLTPQAHQELVNLARQLDDRAIRKWTGEIMVYHFSQRTEAVGHPAEAHAFAFQESQLLDGLVIFLRNGGFIRPKQGPRLPPQRLRELVDEMERREAEENQKDKPANR